ncbi:MAG: TonB-dependent receptor [Moraxellaceae bacterium]|nr:TonB-dependent receptor [Moraxellaceae bacterium]
MMNNYLAISAVKHPPKKISTLIFGMGLSNILLFSEMAMASGDLWDMSLDELGKIRVTSIASGTQTPLDKAAAIATVITADDIAAMGATSIDQVLETVPGLHVTRSSQTYFPKYIIRGITSTFNPQTLMLVNGIPITSLFTGDRGHISGGEMPIKSIARIEVIRGPGSALYGADAFSGVINIVTKQHDDINGTKTGARVGSFGTQSVWLEHGGSYNKVNVGFTLEAETTDGFKRTVEYDAQTVVDNDPQLQATFGAPPASLAPSSTSNMKDSIEARLNIAHDNSLLRVGYQGRYDVGSTVGYAEALDPTSRVSSQRYNLDYTYTLNDLTPNIDVESRVSYYKNTQEVKTNILLFPAGAGAGFFANGFIGNPGYQEENARIDLSALFKGLNNHLIRLGTGFTWDDMFEVTETKNFMVAFQTNGSPVFLPRPSGMIEDVSDTPEVYLPESQRTNHYVFVQDEWKFAPNWQATTGIRYDHFSDFGDTTNPRLALVWAATDKITTKLLYGKAFRAPSFVELFGISNPLTLGNRNLKPETIDTYELALSHQLSSKLLYTANIYRYNIKDFITFVPQIGGAKAQNIGELQGHGLELEADYSPVYNLRFLVNYAYQQSTDKKTDVDVGDAPNQQIYARSEWTVTPDWHFDSQVTWVGKQKRVAGDTRPALSDYTTMDLTLRKQDVINGLELALSVRNVFDADVREPSTGGVVVNMPNDYPMAGRSVYAEVQYQF